MSTPITPDLSVVRRADFGVRLDLDPLTNPDFVGDAFLPPFERDSFDVVILDPPYWRMNRQEIIAVMRAAAWIATNRVLPLEHAWLIRVGDQCAIRTLQRFGVREPKLEPLKPGEFTRGHALKYNRWARAGERLPFTDSMQIGPPAAVGQIIVPGGPAQISEGVFLGDWNG